MKALYRKCLAQCHVAKSCQMLANLPMFAKVELVLGFIETDSCDQMFMLRYFQFLQDLRTCAQLQSQGFSKMAIKNSDFGGILANMFKHLLHFTECFQMFENSAM